ncbi:GntR family transcriptional regulator [Embleya sp. NBC_00896]|uniref:GntR family transcriptional regulator n=1 Tax=Embleya sp. NBC_00896 TaxID=2975961 RepID=UPI003865D62B|nr:GntR family transcriptional regulator [Embleya sp. NBC_00896]
MDTGHGALALPSFDDRPILRDRVARELRAALIAGEMRPGVVYSAPALAAQFGVSPTPVREAMLDLANEGLVEAVRNKGFRVTELSDRELDEFTEVRALIEVPVVARLASVVTPEQLALLRPVAEEIVTAAEAGDLIRYVEADRRFHLSLLSLAGNEHLVRVVGDLRKRSRLYGLSRLAQNGRLTASALEHLELLDALATGDSARAEAVMARHIGHVRNLWADPNQPE